MGLLDQLRLLDRALRDVRVREALRTGDRGGRRLARFAGSVAPADLAVLRAVDARRFEAVAQRQAEMIRDRWWSARFPAVLAGTAVALGGTTRDVAQGALSSPGYDRREGEDETGVALLGYVLGREDRTQDPSWLADLLAYEYLVAVGLPRRSRKLACDPALEDRLLPEGTRFLGGALGANDQGKSKPEARPRARPKAGDLALSKAVVVLPLEFPASEIRETLRSGQALPEDLEPEPHIVVFALDPEGAIELRAPAPGHDLLDTLAAGPIAGDSLLEAFEPADREAAHEALSVLIEAGVVTGRLPVLSLEPPPGTSDEDEAEDDEPEAKPSKKGASSGKPSKSPAGKTAAGKAPVAAARKTGSAATAAPAGPSPKASASKAPASKAPVAKVPASRAPAAKAPAAKAPASKAPASKAPTAKAPVAKAPTYKVPAAKAPAAKAPAAKAPAAKAPAAKAPAAKAPAAKAPAHKPSAAKAPGKPKAGAPANAPAKKSGKPTGSSSARRR